MTWLLHACVYCQGYTVYPKILVVIKFGAGRNALLVEFIFGDLLRYVIA